LARIFVNRRPRGALIIRSLAALQAILLIGTLTVPMAVLASATNDCFRTVQSGDWNNVATWESAASPCSTWSAATLTPTSAASTVTVRAGHTVTVTAAATVRNLVVDGTLTINPSQTLATALSNPTVTVNSTGTVNVNGTLSAASGSGFTAFSVSGALNVNSQLNFPNGAATLTMNSGSALTVNAAGTVSGSGAAGSTVTLASGSTTANAGTISNWGNFNANASFSSSGSITGNAATASALTVASGVTLTNTGTISSWGNINVNGTLTSSGNVSANPGSGGGLIAVAGTLTMTAGTLKSTRSTGASVGSVLNGGTLTLQGTSTLDIESVSGAFFTIANGGTLDIRANATVSGPGQLATAAGANVKIASATGVNGNVTGGKSFDPATNWTFNGASQVTGSLLPAQVGNLTVDQASGNLTLSGSTTMSGVLTLTSGNLLTGANTLAMLPSATSSGSTDVVGTVARSNLSAGTSYSFGNPSNSITVNTGSIPNSALGTQASGMSASATSVTVTETATPPAVPFVILIDSEQMVVTSRTGAANPRTYTLGRGVNGTTAASHSNGTAISFYGQLTLNLVKSAPAGKSDAINRTYTLTPWPSFSGTATIRLHYLDAELNGNSEGNLHLWKQISGTWTDQDPTGASTTRNTSTANWVQQGGFTSFSDWTLAQPAAVNGILTVTKSLTTDDGGSASCADFSFTVDGGTPIQFESDCSNDVTVAAGAHTVVESGTPIAGYSTSYGNNQNANSDCASLSVANGQLSGQVVCTITNNDQQGTLRVNKDLTTNNGSSDSCADFSFTIDGGAPITFDADCSNDVAVNAGAHTVVEVGTPISGFATTYSNNKNGNTNCTALVVANGGAAGAVVCTISNDDQQGVLTVTKTLITNNGGNATCDDFSFSIDGGDPIAFEADCSNDVSVDAGAHDVVEVGTPSGYSVSYANTENSNTDCQGLAVVNGGAAGDVTCTITNDDEAASLVLVKHVINDNGGGAEAGDWTLYADALSVTGSESGAEVTDQIGTYDLSELGGATGYTNTSITCDDAPDTQVTSVTVGLGETITCTFVNDDDAASLVLVKHVINDNGGGASASDWTLYADALSVTGSESGAEVTDQIGSYDLSESTVTGYTNTSLTCDDAPDVQVTSVTLELGQTITCTFVNDDEQGTLRVVKNLTTDNGSFDSCDDFSFTIDGGEPIAFDADCVNDVLVDAGNHTVVEVGVPIVGYDTYYANSENASTDCDNLPVANGGAAGDVFCTVSNDDQQGVLVVTKSLITDNGSLASCADFSFTVDGGDPIAFEEDCSNNVFVNAGAHTVLEVGTPITGFTTTYANSENASTDCATLFVANGGAAGDVTCTITNDDEQGVLSVTKFLPNDNGSDAACEDFSFTIDGGDPIAFEADCTNDVTLDAGSYTVLESGTPINGFGTSYVNNQNSNSDCSSLAVANGDIAGTNTCTITNDDQQGVLRVTKVLPNDNGGDATCDDFSFTVDGGSPIAFEPDCSNDVSVDAGEHDVVESGGPSGYAVSYANSDNSDANCTDLPVANGAAAGDVVCTITNDDQQGVLTVTKSLTTDNGSLATCEDFSFTVDGGSPIAFESDCSNDVAVNAGTHTVLEANVPISDFVTTYGNSQNGDPDCADLAVVNGAGAGDVTCTISNDDLQGTLRVTKTLTADNGSSATCADFAFTIDGGAPIAFEADCSNDVLVNGGSHDVVEDGAPIAGFTTTYANSENLAADCQNLYVANGGDAGDVICTITNDDQQGVLSVTKVLPNDSGSDAACEDFTFSIDGGDPIAFEADCTNDVALDAGSHSVTEDGTPIPGFATTYANSANSNADCANLAVANGEVAGDVTCTITNDDQPGVLTVTKSLTIDNGGDATCDDFTFTVDGGSPIAFESDCSNDVPVDAGNHTVVEDGTLAGYAVSYANSANANSDCTDLAVVNGGAAGDVTCTITNDDIAPTLLVKKHVINDNGGDASASDWLLSVSSSNGGDGTGNAAGDEAGTLYTLQAGKAYSVGESGGPSGYAATPSGDCAIASAALDTEYTCTITNDDQAATLTIIKHVENDNGGSASAGQWTMVVTATNPSDNNFAGSESPGTTISVDAGWYSVSESGGPAGYSPTSSAECSGTAELGGTYTCTLTNDDIQPTVTVTKKVVPAGDPGRFNLLINGTAYATNVGDTGTTGVVGVDAGLRTISETAGTVPPTNLANYTSAINCGAKGSGSGTSLNITLNPGDIVTCTITNSIQDADGDGIPNFLDCSTVKANRVVDPAGSLAAYLPLSVRHMTLQAAVNAAADNDVIEVYANTTDNVEIGGAGVGAASAGKDLRIIGCGHRITAAVASKPVINILSNAGKNDGNTGAGEADIHIEDLDVKGGSYGYMVQTSKPGTNNTNTLLKSIRSTSNGVGVSIVGNGNELRGANSISLNTSGAVQVNGNNNTIRNNRIEQNTGIGIAVSGGAILIKENTVTGNSGTGIVVVGCASNTVLTNDVYSNGGGIVLSGPSSFVTDNNVGDLGKGNAGDGINVNSNSTQIVGNDIYANTGRGIVVAGNSNAIRQNDVGDKSKGNGAGGIVVNGNSNEVSENDVIANTGHGINVTGNTNTVMKNDVGDMNKGNTGDGIRLTGDGNTVGKGVDQNNVFGNGGSGIVVMGNNNTLSKNDVGEKGKGNGGDGIRVVGYGNTLSENDSYANGGDGFDISGGTASKPNVLVKNNAGKTGAGNGANGFLISGTGNPKAKPTELDQNTAKGNTLNGFYLTGTGMDLSKNTSGGNGGDDNGDYEFLFSSTGNWNLGGNKYNSTSIAGSTPAAFASGGLGTP
jgi:hypothetical protein